MADCPVEDQRIAAFASILVACPIALFAPGLAQTAATIAFSHTGSMLGHDGTSMRCRPP
jgi:hypothetical protein